MMNAMDDFHAMMMMVMKVMTVIAFYVARLC